MYVLVLWQWKIVQPTFPSLSCQIAKIIQGKSNKLASIDIICCTSPNSLFLGCKLWCKVLHTFWKVKKNPYVSLKLVVLLIAYFLHLSIHYKISCMTCRFTKANSIQNSYRYVEDITTCFVKTVRISSISFILVLK